MHGGHVRAPGRAVAPAAASAGPPVGPSEPHARIVRCTEARQTLDREVEDRLYGDHRTVLAGMHALAMPRCAVPSTCGDARVLPRLHPLWNGSSGDCLLDACAQALWGVPVTGTGACSRLRRALADS